MKDKIMTLNLDLETINAVLDALANLPFRQSAGIIQNIQKQASEQLNKHSELEETNEIN